jgi:hypothetical protein
MSIYFREKSHFFNKNWKKYNGDVDVFGLDKKRVFDQNLDNIMKVDIREKIIG